MICRYGLMIFMLAVVVQVQAGISEKNTVENYLRSSVAAGKKPNNLVREVSPYLLQHAYNPVQWYAWGEQAFAKARKENKPIFLSIGYSTCHWCHVMAHESFENEEIAAILNKYFISIKVDREERPDIDNVYMSAAHLIIGQGGWPLTVFLNHDLAPFHAGTYYPPEDVGNLPGLKGLLLDVQKLWTLERERVDTMAAVITVRIKAMADESDPGETLNKEIDRDVMNQFSLGFDDDYGGFGAAPKFPRPGTFSYLLRLAIEDNEAGKNAKKMMQKTLKFIAHGGIYDQLGGGFHRYSVDASWQVPHFEKMLYSQALMVMAYSRLYQLDKKPLYIKIINKTLEYVMNEMTSAQGGFYSALDADSERPEKPGEHAEGAYYLWFEKELKNILSSEEWKLFHVYYNIQPDGNILSDPQNEFETRNILHISETYRNKALTKKQRTILDSANKKLLTIRNKRPRPHLDDKIITAWNGMMIAAFAEAHQALHEEQYLNAAVTAAGFVHKRLFNNKTGELYRRVRGKHAGAAAGLDDYVWYTRGLIDLYRVTNDKNWLQLAIKITKKQNELFYDEENGGYFDSSDKDTSVLFRSKSIYDGALPAANAVAYENLLDLKQHTGDRMWLKYADGTLDAFAAVINDNPAAASMMLYASMKNRL